MNSKYKIAVMGESNVGKTVFFGSYFHQATDLGKAKYTVAIKSQESDDKITEIITQLFEKRQAVAGTDVRADFSFSVDALGMDIELADLPGGFTTNRNYWDDESVRKDLRDADGALFFISGYDVIHNPAEALKVNRAFADAISEIRLAHEGDMKGRADVPIWFIFTKGDKIPGVTADELTSRVPSLIEAAKSQQVRGSWFARKIYRKGGYVRPYKTQAMGVWPNETTPPVDFQPVNVVEPMDELFEAMHDSKSAHRGKFAKIVGTLAILAVIGAESFAFWVDRQYFDSAKNNIEHLRETGKYSEAIREIDGYHPPFTSIMIPGFLRAGEILSEIRNDTWKQYEAALYAPISSEISKIDSTRIPETDEVFYDTIRKAEEYISTTQFAQVSPEHYAKVRGSMWFFEAVKLLNFDPLAQEVTPDDEFDAVLRCLNYEAPEAWRDNIQSRIDNILRHWGRTSPAEGDPASLEPYIDRAQQLIAHPNLSQEVVGYLTERVNFWHSEQAGRWQNIAESWIRDAKSAKPDEGLEYLSSRMAGKIPPDVRKSLEDARNSLYTVIADTALQRYADDIGRLRSTVSKYPSMPHEDKDRLITRIDYLHEKALESEVRKIRSAKTISALAKISQELGEDIKAGVIAQALSGALEDLAKARLAEILAEASSLAGNNNYPDAKQAVLTGMNRLQQEIRSVTDDRKLTGDVSSREREINEHLMSAHYEYCKSAFTSRKYSNSPRDVGVCLSEARKYLETWPESLQTREGAEVRQAAAFLEAIQGGVPGSLIVVEGNFEAIDSKLDTPDMKIIVETADSLWETETIKDKIDPKFHTRHSIRWSVDMSPITFRGVEVDPMFDDEDVFVARIYPRGFFGYSTLTGDLRDNNCRLTIRFEPSGEIPSCTW